MYDVDEWLCTLLLLDMIWIKVVSQHFTYQPPPSDGCIKINTITWTSSYYHVVYVDL